MPLPFMNSLSFLSKAVQSTLSLILIPLPSELSHTMTNDSHDQKEHYCFAESEEFKNERLKKTYGQQQRFFLSP